MSEHPPAPWKMGIWENKYGETNFASVFYGHREIALLSSRDFPANEWKELANEMVCACNEHAVLLKVAEAAKVVSDRIFERMVYEEPHENLLEALAELEALRKEKK